MILAITWFVEPSTTTRPSAVDTKIRSVMASTATASALTVDTVTPPVNVFVLPSRTARCVKSLMAYTRSVAGSTAGPAPGTEKLRVAVTSSVIPLTTVSSPLSS